MLQELPQSAALLPFQPIKQITSAVKKHLSDISISVEQILATMQEAITSWLPMVHCHRLQLRLDRLFYEPNAEVATPCNSPGQLRIQAVRG